MIVIAFGLVMLVIGTASMVPISLYTQRRLTDRDAVLVASALLTIGLGAINTAALFIFAVRGDIEYFVLPIGLAPVLTCLPSCRRRVESCSDIGTRSWRMTWVSGTERDIVGAEY